jgi:hypothetical protein
MTGRGGKRNGRHEQRKKECCRCEIEKFPQHDGPQIPSFTIGSFVMRVWWLSCFAILSLPARAGTPLDTVIAPPQAIAMADSAKPRIGATGRFVIQVAATGRVGGAIFLNSSSDYRAPDDLSFRLSPNVVAELTRHYGESPETYLRNRSVTVNGTVRRELIVNRDDYFPKHIVSANRWQHIVRILFAHQIVSVQ